MSSSTEFFLLLDRRQNTWTILELINPDESKRADKMLELALSQVFSCLDESKKADKPTLDLSWVVFMAWMRPDSARPIPELFNPDESKRAKKMLELALS
jgi:hypothetical protein